MRHKKHDNHSHALEEDAPEVLGHGSISKWAIVVTERCTADSMVVRRDTKEMVGIKFNIGIQYSLHMNSVGYNNSNFMMY